MAIGGLTLTAGLGVKGIDSAGGGGIPFRSDLQTWLKERAGLDLSKQIGTKATILPSCGKIDANNYLSKTISNFNIADSFGYVESKFYYNGTSTAIRLFSTADANNTARYFYLTIASGKPTLAIRAFTNAFLNIIQTTEVLSVGWHTVRSGSTGSEYYIIVDGVTQAITATTGSNNGKWLNLVESRVNISIGAVLISTPLYSQEAYIDYVDYNGKSKWYLSGVGGYEYDTIAANNLAWTGTAHIFYSSEASTYYLDNGWELFTKALAATEQVPITATTTDIEAAGYAKAVWGDFAASATEINMANCLVQFADDDNFDRSNETIHSALSRASAYYDAANPTRWHISEIADPRVYTEYLNVGYAGKLYSKIATQLISSIYYIKSLSEVLSYTTDKTGVNQLKVMKYCGTDVFAE